MRTISMINQKGGCGKTTSAVNTSAAFAYMQKRVLLIDLDPQAHATIGMGINPNNCSKTIYDIMVKGKTQIADVALKTDFNGLDIIPCNVLLASAEMELGGVSIKELLLGNALRNVRNKYDICVIDCPPSLGILTLNALVCSTDVIVPVQVHYYAIEGLKRLLETISIIRRRFHPYSVESIRMLLTFVEERTKFSRQIQQQLREIFGELVFTTVIHRNIRLAEAPSAGETILKYAPHSKGAADYKALAAEILQTELPEENLEKVKQRRGIQKELSEIFQDVWLAQQQSNNKYQQTNLDKKNVSEQQQENPDQQKSNYDQQQNEHQPISYIEHNGT